MVLERITITTGSISFSPNGSENKRKILEAIAELFTFAGYRIGNMASHSGAMIPNSFTITREIDNHDICFTMVVDVTTPKEKADEGGFLEHKTN